MKLGSYNGQFVALVHKLSNGKSRICYVKEREYIDDVGITKNGEQDFVGQPFVVDSVDVQPLEYPPLKRGKTELSQCDLNRLNAARGLDLNAKGGVNHLGLKPTVTIYNLAVHKRKLAGAPIVPIL